MSEPKVFPSEYRFCEVLWENEPINSTKLMKICRERLGWSKATTYTVIRRLSERGIIKNENTIVSSIRSKTEVRAAEANEVIGRTFAGSLPAFIAAFTTRNKLTQEEIEEIRRMIDKKED